MARGTPAGAAARFAAGPAVIGWVPTDGGVMVLCDACVTPELLVRVLRNAEIALNRVGRRLGVGLSMGCLGGACRRGRDRRPTLVRLALYTTPGGAAGDCSHPNLSPATAGCLPVDPQPPSGAGHDRFATPHRLPGAARPVAATDVCRRRPLARRADRP